MSLQLVTPLGEGAAGCEMKPCKMEFKTKTKTKTLNRHLPYDPATVPLGFYTREMKTYVHSKTRTGIFTVALFIIAKYRRQPKYPPI